jgi:uncharacterized protein (DUF2147 family)
MAHAHHPPGLSVAPRAPQCAATNAGNAKDQQPLRSAWEEVKMGRRLFATAVGGLALGLACTAALAQQAEEAFGVWLNPENGSNIELYKCGGGLCAKLTKVSDSQKTDDKNPDPAKRNQPIIGLVIMENAQKSRSDRWAGTLYNRESGKSYAGTITVKNRDLLELSGCVMAVLCRTVTWTRIR